MLSKNIEFKNFIGFKKTAKVKKIFSDLKKIIDSNVNLFFLVSKKIIKILFIIKK